MKIIDQSYQTTVDKEAEKVLAASINDFIATNDYGTIEASINENKINIAYWHHKLSNDIHHIVFQADRKVFLFFHKKYLSGVKLDNGKISKLTDTELGDYD
jgi:hypothetical protein